jgi:hypothetical protein
MSECAVAAECVAVVEACGVVSVSGIIGRVLFAKERAVERKQDEWGRKKEEKREELLCGSTRMLLETVELSFNSSGIEGETGEEEGGGVDVGGLREAIKSAMRSGQSMRL